MFNSFLNELGYLPAGQAYMQAVRALLQPLKKRWPEMVTQAIEAADGGARLEAAGQVLCEALTAWENQVEEQAARKAQTVEQNAFALEKRVEELEALDTDKDRRIEHMQSWLNDRNVLIQKMANQIKAQNVVIAEQHQKLASIFGDADNSQDAQKLLS